jgi:hypothetical protein
MGRPYEQREFTTGNIVGEALALYRRFFVRFVSVALAVFLVTNLVAALATVPAGDTARAAIFVLAAVIGIAAFFVVQGALVATVDDVRDGGRGGSHMRAFSRARDRFPFLLGTGLVVGLALGAVSIGIVLCGRAVGHTWVGILIAVVAVLFLATRWSLATPIVVLAGLGPIAALRRSFALVRGHTGRALWILVLTGILAGLTGAIVKAILHAVLSGFLSTWLAGSVSNALTAPLLALCWALMYFHLRSPEDAPAAAAEGSTAIEPPRSAAVEPEDT